MFLARCWNTYVRQLATALPFILFWGCGSTSSSWLSQPPDTLSAELVASPDDFAIVATAIDGSDDKWLLSIKRNNGQGQGGTLEFVWDFGDGTTANGTEQTFVPTTSGLHTITVTAYDNNGKEQFALTLSLEVPTLSLPAGVPVAEAGTDLSAIPGETVTLNGGFSSDPDGDPLFYNWTQIAGTLVLLSESTGPMPTFVAPDIQVAERLVFVLAVSDGQYESQDFVAVEVSGNGEPTGEAPTCTFSVLLDGSPDVLAGPRPVSVVSSASVLQGEVTADAIFTWTIDSGTVSGPVAEYQTMSHTFNSVGVHVLAVALTSAGVSVNCVSTRSNSLSESTHVYPRISGRVTDANGVGLIGATVTTGDGVAAVTGVDGAYFVDVPPGWSGRITPRMDGFDFAPQQHSYADLSIDATGDFTADSSDTTREGCSSDADCDDGVTCTADRCDLATATCSITPDDSACDNGLYCDGPESCDPAAGCVPGTGPCPLGEICDESNDSCNIIQCVSDSDCADGLFCNGAETCINGSCVDGTSPCAAGDACDEAVDSCQSGATVSGSITMVDTVGARSQVGQIHLSFTGTFDFVGIDFEVVTEPTGAFQQDVPVGWTGTVAATDPNRVVLITPRESWTFGTGGEAAAVTQNTRIDFTAWTAPIGVPAPAFGIRESHRMYDGIYSDAGNGPFTHYVDNSAPSATDSDNPYGTPTQPRLTIPLDLPAGSVVELHGGPYTSGNYSGTRLGITGTGTAEAPIFVRGFDNANKTVLANEVVIRGSYIIVENVKTDTIGDNEGMLQVWNPSDHVVVRHSEGTNLPDPGAGFRAVWGVIPKAALVGGDAETAFNQDIVFFNNNVHDNGPWPPLRETGIHAITCGGNTRRLWVLDNKLDYNGEDGIQVFYSSAYANYWAENVYIGGNLIHHNVENAIDIKQSHDVIISQNKCYSHTPITFPNGSGSDGTAIVVHYAPTNIWILYNEIFDSVNAIRNNGSEQTYVIGNIMYDIHHDPTADYDPNTIWSSGTGVISWATTELHVVGNTMYDVDSGISYPSDGTPTPQLHIANNIIANLAEPAHHIGVSVRSVAENSTMSHNVLYDESGSARIKWGGTSIVYNLDSFMQTFPTQAMGCSELSPQFRDPATGDFRPRDGSPAIDAATEHAVYAAFQSRYGLPITYDFAGRVRPEAFAWEIGALEAQD